MPDAQSNVTQQIYINTWVYHLQRSELDLAQADIESMKRLPLEYGAWHNVKSWKFFQSYFKEYPNSEPQIQSMWEQLPKRS